MDYRAELTVFETSCCAQCHRMLANLTLVGDRLVLDRGSHLRDVLLCADCQVDCLLIIVGRFFLFCPNSLLCANLRSLNGEFFGSCRLSLDINILDLLAFGKRIVVRR